MVNMQIVNSTEGTLSEQQTNQEPDEKGRTNMKKPTCNEASEHLNGLRCFMESISKVPQQIWKTLWDMENYILQQTKENYKQYTLDNFLKKL
jgi:hypothetical protein